MKSPFENSDNLYVIAEIGKNFIQSKEEVSIDEYISNSKELIDAAKDSGADAVKFQTHNFEDEQINVETISPHFKDSDRYSWIVRNTNATPLRFWREISSYCEKKKITFFSTPMSRQAARKISNLVPFWKVGSGDLQDYILINELIKTKKPIIISTGMVSFHELDKVVNYIYKNGNKLGILYCVSKYPCPKEEFNLSTIKTFESRYPNILIGFSDHSIGFEASLAAAKMGARVIEKHFSIDRELWGSDHKISMTPKEMKELITLLREKSFEKVNENFFYGQPDKELEGANNMFRPYFGKKLVAASDLPKGTTLTEDIIFAMRPSKSLEGFPANELSRAVGKITTKSLKKYDSLNKDSVQL